MNAAFGGGRRIVQHQLDQAARADVFADRPIGHQRNAQAAQDSQPPRIAIVTFKREPRPGSPLTACDLAPPPHAGAVSAVNEAVLFCQLGKMVRTAMLLQLGGGGAAQVAVASAALADEASVGVMAHAPPGHSASHNPTN